MYGYTYITTNRVNNKQYIGQHKSTKFDSTYLGSGIQITRAIKKYGKSNFNVEILEECESFEQLNESEIRWIQKLDAVNSPNFYNVAEGGHHSVTIQNLKNTNPEGYDRYLKGLQNSIHTRQSEAHREKLSKQYKDNPPFEGHHHTQSAKDKIARYKEDNPFYGKHHTEETKKYLAQCNTGRKHTEAEKQKMAAARVGRTHSEETKRKMAESRKLYWANKKKNSGATTIESIAEN